MGNKVYKVEEEMTVMKVNDRETRTVLDFSGSRYSKNKIRQHLKNIEIETYRVTGEKSASGDSMCFVDNEIKVGIFTVKLYLSYEDGLRKLRDYNVIAINICENNRENPYINICTNPFFRKQYWAAETFEGFNIRHLTDVISHLQRLNNLKAFL